MRKAFSSLTSKKEAPPTRRDCSLATSFRKSIASPFARRRSFKLNWGKAGKALCSCVSIVRRIQCLSRLHAEQHKDTKCLCVVLIYSIVSSTSSPLRLGQAPSHRSSDYRG